MTTMNQAESIVFDGPVGQAIHPLQFAPVNYIRNPRLHACEGDWVFCLLQGPEVYAARFGFTQGPANFVDYGANEPCPSSNLQVHLELLTQSGAMLWHGTGLHDGRELRTSPDQLDMRMPIGSTDLFHVSGWPHVRWVVQSSDQSISLDVTLDMTHVVILPDSLLQHITFAMWLATADIHGQCRIDGKTHPIQGKAFYDHPRIMPVENHVAPFGMYHYTPMVLADGSQLISYYSSDRENRRNPDYSFAYWLKPGQPMVSLRSTALDGLTFDDDRQPISWRQRWEGQDITLEASFAVTPMPISRIWGGPSISQSRRSNPLIPLPFDSSFMIRERGQVTQTTGRGLAECVIHPELARRVIGG